MRPRDRILTNLESIYRESYDRAHRSADEGRMIDPDMTPEQALARLREPG